jgi:hypothetical protein
MSGFCKICGSPKQAKEEFCPACHQGDLDDYKIVRNYLRAHPNSNAMQVSNATGISISKILRYVRNGSLSVVDNDGPRR